MKRQWHIIPQLEGLDSYVRLAEEYGVRFEYNDFYDASVYQSDEEIERRIDIYTSLNRDRSRDTLHGVFKDISVFSEDDVIRDRSRALMEQSMDIARALGVKGVVFHTGIIGNFSHNNAYIDSCLSIMVPYLKDLSDMYPELDIYMENSFEKTTYPFTRLMELTEEYDHIRLCLDYAHAVLTPTAANVWVHDLAPYIGHMHINDNDLISDLHQVPGEGRIDYIEYKRLMEANELDVSTLIELFGIDRERRALDYMNNL